MLGVEGLALDAMLTQSVTIARGETFTKQLSPANANLTRDAIVKSLYEVRVRCGMVWKAMPQGDCSRLTNAVMRMRGRLLVDRVEMHSITSHSTC